MLEAKDLVVFQVAEFGPQQIFHHPFLKFPLPLVPSQFLLFWGPSRIPPARMNLIEEEEELEEIALEPDFNYSTCNLLGGKFKADYPAYRRLHTKTDASTFGHLVPNDCGLHDLGFRLERWLWPGGLEPKWIPSMRVYDFGSFPCRLPNHQVLSSTDQNSVGISTIPIRDSSGPCVWNPATYQ